MTDDTRKLIEIEGLRNEAFTSTDSRVAQLAADELVKRVDAGVARPEDRLLKAIEAELLSNPTQYRNTLDVCDGNERTAAALILDHMVQLLRRGRSWPMVKSMAHFDMFCGYVVRGQTEQAIQELKRRGGEMRANGARVVDLME